jgi:hypothetical protein
MGLSVDGSERLDGEDDATKQLVPAHFCACRIGKGLKILSIQQDDGKRTPQGCRVTSPAYTL